MRLADRPRPKVLPIQLSAWLASIHESRWPEIEPEPCEQVSVSQAIDGSIYVEMDELQFADPFVKESYATNFPCSRRPVEIKDALKDLGLISRDVERVAPPLAEQFAPPPPPPKLDWSEPFLREVGSHKFSMGEWLSLHNDRPDEVIIDARRRDGLEHIVVEIPGLCRSQITRPKDHPRHLIVAEIAAYAEKRLGPVKERLAA